MTSHIAAVCFLGFCPSCISGQREPSCLTPDWLCSRPGCGLHHSDHRDPEAEEYEEAQQRKPDGHIAAFRPVSYARTVCGECYIGDCHACDGFLANGGECECSRCEARAR